MIREFPLRLRKHVRPRWIASPICTDLICDRHRTYGARRVWHDVLAEGVSCGLHRIERLMRAQALRARPRRRRLSPLAYGAVVIAFAL